MNFTEFLRPASAKAKWLLMHFSDLMLKIETVSFLHLFFGDS